MIDVIHVLRSKTIRGEKGGDVAKLFARHIKLEDHISYLRRTKIGSGVGTPGRIGKLLCDSGRAHELIRFRKDSLISFLYSRRAFNVRIDAHYDRCFFSGRKEAIDARHSGDARRDVSHCFRL